MVTSIKPRCFDGFLNWLQCGAVVLAISALTVACGDEPLFPDGDYRQISVVGWSTYLGIEGAWNITGDFSITSEYQGNDEYLFICRGTANYDSVPIFRIICEREEWLYKIGSSGDIKSGTMLKSYCRTEPEITANNPVAIDQGSVELLADEYLKFNIVGRVGSVRKGWDVTYQRWK
jgi:hypothetical protein